MTKSAPEDILPLSSLQEGMLFHALYDEQGHDVYTVQIVLDLGGRLDVAALQASAAALLARHANLRVGFLHPKEGRPVQVVPTDGRSLRRALDGWPRRPAQPLGRIS